MAWLVAKFNNCGQTLWHYFNELATYSWLWLKVIIQSSYASAFNKQKYSNIILNFPTSLHKIRKPFKYQVATSSYNENTSSRSLLNNTLILKKSPEKNLSILLLHAFTKFFQKLGREGEFFRHADSLLMDENLNFRLHCLQVVKIGSIVLIIMFRKLGEILIL